LLLQPTVPGSSAADGSFHLPLSVNRRPLCLLAKRLGLTMELARIARIDAAMAEAVTRESNPLVWM